MADPDKKSFPQVPATVWWGLREQFKKKIPSVVTDTYLATQLNVQAGAAKAYLVELKRLGLIDEDGKPSAIANKWRMDETYREASDEILSLAYPSELLDSAPPNEGDRDKAVRWFMMTAGLGDGSARNKAATYFMIGDASPPDEAPKVRTSAASERKPRATGAVDVPNGNDGAVADPPGDRRPPASMPPLNVNVQIHISADANNDQIEAIFANMKKYLT